jgi:hypothetical protein
MSSSFTCSSLTSPCLWTRWNRQFRFSILKSQYRSVFHSLWHTLRKWAKPGRLNNWHVVFVVVVVVVVVVTGEEGDPGYWRPDSRPFATDLFEHYVSLENILLQMGHLRDHTKSLLTSPTKAVFSPAEPRIEPGSNDWQAGCLTIAPRPPTEWLSKYNKD